MTTYHQLRATSYHLNLAALQPARYHVLRYPAAWRAPLLELFRSSKDRDPERYRQLPIRSLSDAITLLAPDVVRDGRYYIDWNGERWLYATTPVDPQRLVRIVHAWIRTLGKQRDLGPRDHDLLAAALEAVRPGAPGWADFHWEPLTVDFAREAARVGDNGTAAPGPLLFDLLPHMLTGALSAPGLDCPHGPDESTAFRRSTQDNYAEVTSWLPASDAHPFSYTMAWRAQTIPGRPDPAVYAHFGVRRWAYRGAHLSARRDSTVYILHSSPLLADTGSGSRAFRRIGARWRPGREPGQGRVEWTSRLQRILTELSLTDNDRLPDPAALAVDPSEYLRRATRDDAVALVFREDIGRHQVEPGLSVRERRELFEWATAVLESWITADEPYTRVFGPQQIATSPRKTKNALDRAQDKIKKRIRDEARATGSDPAPALAALPSKFAELVRTGLTTVLTAAGGDRKLALEVHHWEDSALPDIITTAISKDLGDPVQDGTQTVWQLPTGAVHLTTHVVCGAHADKIDLPQRPKATDVHTALTQRATEIQKTLPITRAITACIVEINQKDYFKSQPAGDPKPAFRLAHAHTGRTTQFIYPPTGESSDQERASHAWRDVQRQLGVQLVPPRVKIRNHILPDPLYYLAIWVVRTNVTAGRKFGRRVPVLVYLDSTGQQSAKLIAPYFDDWLDYRDGLTQLARQFRFETEARTPENDGFVRRFLLEHVRDATTSRRDTLLFTHANNLRADWAFVTNTKLGFDHLESNTLAGTGLRHIRIREMGEGYEVPDVYGIGDDEKPEWGLSGGLWHVNGNRVFASTTDKPTVAHKARHNLSKVDSYTFTPRRKPEDTHEPGPVTLPPTPSAEVWNSRMLEITVAGVQDGDDPRDWATIAHQLRWAHPHYDDGTILPMPLHLAQLAGHYVLPAAHPVNPDSDNSRS